VLVGNDARQGIQVHENGAQTDVTGGVEVGVEQRWLLGEGEDLDMIDGEKH
jgi:hypothetical protein